MGIIPRTKIEKQVTVQATDREAALEAYRKQTE